MIPRLSAKAPVDSNYLAFIAELEARGFEGEISRSQADRTVLSTDNSIYQVVPQAVAFPKNNDDLVRIMTLLAEPRFHDISLTARGGGTGTNGQSLSKGLIVDTSRHMNRILEIDPDKRYARVQAGVVKDQLNLALKPYGLFFAPELSTSNRATIGGMINTDASGQGSCIYGKTRDHVLELDTVLLGGALWKSAPMSDMELGEIQRRDDRIGEIHRLLDRIRRDDAELIERVFPKLNRCLTGYDLAHIRDRHGRFDLNAVLCGSEGTLGIIAEAKLNVLPIPKHSALVNIRYASFDAALRDAPMLKELKAASIETVDSKVLQMARQDNIWLGVKEFFPDDRQGEAQGINLVEFLADDQAALNDTLKHASEKLAEGGAGSRRLGHTIARGEQAVNRIWNMRKKAVGLLGNLKGSRRPIPFVEDTCVPPEHLADYIAEFRALLDRRGLAYGMFGHVDVGVLHVRPAIDMKDAGQEHLIREITDEVVALTRKYHGLLWGEHGKGVRSEYAPAFFGPLYPHLQSIKACFDPRNQLNPGKVAAAGAELLKLDAVPTRGRFDRRIPIAVRTEYEDALHCNGNGACYNFDADDAMCPSWKGTRERRHSPKGRASLMREWLLRLATLGVDPVDESRRARSGLLNFPRRLANTISKMRGESDYSHEVLEAMSGCLACKSCVGQCPVKVDVPAFRSRFLELYYGRYLRPLRDHLIGSLEFFVPYFSRIPRLYNALLSGPAGRLFLRCARIVDSPPLSEIGLEQEIRSRGFRIATPEDVTGLAADDRSRAVVVVQDAFTSYFETQLALDVFALLKLLGFIPFLAPYKPNGKPLHVHGFLKRFEATAHANASMLRQLQACGIPLVGIDPSMTLTYRAEYGKALGADRTVQVHLIQEWLATRLQQNPPPQDGARVFRLLPHCTEKTNAPSSISDWQTVFRAFGATLDIVACGCCGMAGTYGHEAEHLAASARIYRQSWGAHLNAGRMQTMLATGYSCRCQAKRMDGIALRHPIQALLDLQRERMRFH